MKKLTLLLLTFFCCICTYAQQDTLTYYGKSNYYFEKLDKSQITSGLMSDYGIEFLDLESYNGATNNTGNFVGLQELRLLYASLYSSQINGNANLQPLENVNSILSNNIALNKPITFAVLLYNYQNMRTDAVSANLITVSNDQMYDVPGRQQSPYKTNQVFAAAPIRQAVTLGNNQILFKSDLFYSNSGKTLQSAAVDIGETGSYQTVQLNSPSTVNFTQTGFVSIAIRMTFSDGTICNGHTKVLVYPLPDSSTSNTASKNTGNQTQRFGLGRTVTKETVVATKSYLGKQGKGDITIQLSQNNYTGQIRKPLIVVEGFDMDNTYEFEDWARSTLIDQSGNNPPQYISLNDDLDNNKEYDLIFLNFEDATDYIQRNAFLLEKVIEIVNSRKTTYNGVRQDNVVLGLSMGGLVTRYGLRDMEISNLAHETRLFISHDTPHQGANVPVGAQAAVQHLGAFKIVNTSSNFPYIKWVDMFPDLATSNDAFNTPAAKQMIIQRYALNPFNYTLSADNGTYNNFFNEINNLGWPTNTKNILLSNGTCNGTQIFQAGERIFELIGERPMSYGGNLWRSFAMSSLAWVTPAIVYGGNVNPAVLLVQFPLSLISTKSAVNLDFRLNAVPSSGTAELYRGDVYIKRKLVWFINSNSYIMKTRVQSIQGMKPLDNAPGGVYDMNTFGVNPSVISSQLPDFFQGIQAVIKQPRFCFVPTVSSLSISNPWQNLNQNLCSTVNCSNPSTVRNFFAQQANQLHISYSQPSANWILQWQEPGYDCIKFCKSSLGITGPPNVCNSSTYSISNLPSGVNINWSINGIGAQIESSTNNSVTVNKVDNGGKFKIIASLQTSCETFSTETAEMDNTVPQGYVSYANAYCEEGCAMNKLCSNIGPYSEAKNTLTYQLTDITSYPVRVNYRIYGLDYISPTYHFKAYLSSGYQYITTDLPPNECSISVWISNQNCEDFPALAEEVYEISSEVVNCGSSYRFVTYPNPASNTMTITQNNQEAGRAEAELTSKMSFSILLLNVRGQVLRSAESRDGNDIVISTDKIMDGNYFLHIIQGKDKHKKQVVIKH
ncbi:T9SS type A sorting domain-containing protein [Pedobacter sp. WC2501]|uniref:T9SS type A sorting domain-containing protein n=1 Tax=Pedobacter sp. WC2501 TaxID=3461400 RepID=UPI004046458B